MKISFILLLLPLLVLAKGASAQNVTLEASNMRVEQILSVISQQTGLTPAYSNQVVNVNRRISLRINNEDVRQALDKLVDGTKLSYEIADGKIFLFEKGSASMPQQSQKITISGTVVDELGEPVIGANVMEMGTSNGIITDFDGNFQLQANPNATLKVSYIGYIDQQVAINGQQKLIITLEEDLLRLEEVVVIGYGSMKKGEITSAITSVKADDFVKGMVRSPAQLLQGKVAGLQITNPTGDPTAGVEMTIRGTTSIKGGTDPLIIIDGVPGGSLNSIAAEDIESIDVLKDGSAAAIYGTRGTNGVIIITTKKAQAGKATLDYSGYVTIETLQKKTEMLTAADYRRLKNDPVVGDFIDDQGATTDWIDAITRTALSHVHNLSLRGGSQETNYIASVTYRTQEGTLLNSKKDALTAKIALNHNMFDNKLRFQANMYNNYITQTGVWYNSYLEALRQNPTRPVYNEDGSYTEYGISYRPYNPVALLKEETDQKNYNELLVSGKVTYSPLRELNLSVMGAIQRYDGMKNKWNTFQHYSTVLNSANGMVWNTADWKLNRTLELLADYSKNIDKHTFTVMGGYSYQDGELREMYQEAKNFPTDIFEAWNIGASLDIKDGKAIMTSKREENKLISFFGRVTYNYDEKYMFMASLRREGSSRFGDNHKWGMFPAVSAGWRMNREAFMENVNWVNELKVRIGFGVTGTEVTDNYKSLVLLNYDKYGYMNGQWIQGVKPANNPNPDLKWETKAETNVGIDFSVLNNRLSGSIDLYRRVTSDLLADYSVPVPPNFTSTMMANVGKIRNQGIELVLNSTIVQTKDFFWSVAGNFSYNANKLLSLSNEKYEKDFWYEGDTGSPIAQNTHIVKEGEPIGNFYGWKCVGLTRDGLWLVQGQDGKEKLASEAGQEDKQILGNGLPSMYAGLNMTFGYKDFDLSFSLRGAFDYQILNRYRMHWESMKSLSEANLPASVLDKPFGGDTYVLDSPMYHSYFVENGDYVKLDNLTVGYTFNKMNKKVIKNMRLYVTGMNLFTITGYKGLNPEVSTKGLAPGVEGSNNTRGEMYPGIRSFAIGLNVTL